MTLLNEIDRDGAQNVLTYKIAIPSPRKKRIYAVFYLAILVPTLALSVRRLRDAGFHWAFIFLRFAPMGGIALMILHAMPTKETKVVNYSEPQAVNVEEVIEVTPFEDSDKN